MSNSKRYLHRREAVAEILAGRDENLLVVSGLGTPGNDVAAAGDYPLNFYLRGAMGHAALVGLGLALAQPKKRVLVITGDGDMLMGLGALATIADQAPRNLAIVVVDNEAFGETGGQRTSTSGSVDLAGMAAAAGFPTTLTARTKGELAVVKVAVREGSGPVLAVVKVQLEKLPRILSTPRDGARLKDRFRLALLGKGAA